MTRATFRDRFTVLPVIEGLALSCTLCVHQEADGHLMSMGRNPSMDAFINAAVKHNREVHP